MDRACASRGRPEGRDRRAGWLLRLLWFGPGPVDAGTSSASGRLPRPTRARTRSIATQVLGLMYGLRGDFERGRELLVESGAMQLELGMEIARAAGNAMMSAGSSGWLKTMTRRRSSCDQPADVLRNAGEKGYYSTVLGFLAQVSYSQGKYDEAASWRARATR